MVDNVVPSVTVAFSAQVNPWNATTHKSPLAATYTARLKIADPTLIGTNPASAPPGKAANAVYPQGSGYATVIITAGGGVTWIGRMGDGTSPTTTCTTTLAADSTFPVRLILNAGTGASQGMIQAAADTANANNHLPLLDGTLDWSKKTQPLASTDRTYKNGIPLFNLTVAGGQYVVPLSGNPVLTIAGSNTPGMNNARLLFTDGGLTAIASVPSVTGSSLAGSLNPLSMRITPANTGDFSNTTGNPAGVALTLNAATGALSGTFTLNDGGVVRKVSYAGLLVPRVSVNMGVGSFVLTELPASATSPMLAGQVLLVKGP